MFGPIGATELIIILVLALIIFGPGKLPDVGKAIGRSIKEFKRASSAFEDDVKGSGGRQSQSTTAGRTDESINETTNEPTNQPANEPANQPAKDEVKQS